MSCRIDTVQIQIRKNVPDHADYAAPIRQHDLDHTIQIRNLSALEDLDNEDPMICERCVAVYPSSTMTVSLILMPTPKMILFGHAEYDNMDLEMLQEVVPMLKQQLEKAMLDRNYVQLERVRAFARHTYLLSSDYPTDHVG